MFEFFAGIKHFQEHKQHTSKDAEFIAVHDHATSTTRFKCYNTSNDKIQQLYADTNKLHKCLKFLLELNIFKNTKHTHQKMQNSSLYTIKDSSATRFKCYKTPNDKIQQLYAVANKLHKRLNFLLELNIFKHTNNTHQKMQNSSLYTIKDSSATRFKCYNTSNDKIQQLCANTNKLHKCLKFLLELNIFKNTKHTHQKMQNSSLYTIKDSSATRFKCYKTSNDKIQQLYAVANKLHKRLNFLLELNIFKHTNNTHQKMQNSSLYTIKEGFATRFKCYNTSKDKILQLYAVTNKLHKCLNFLLELNIFKKTYNTHQKMQNSSLYTITPLPQSDSNATLHKTTGFSNCMQSRTNCISV